jgi:hypothetical protein
MPHAPVGARKPAAQKQKANRAARQKRKKGAIRQIRTASRNILQKKHSLQKLEAGHKKKPASFLYLS